MTIGVPNFFGERLTEARLARGLFKNALADMIGVTPMAITRYEANQDKPTLERLSALADKLSFPADFFTKPPFGEQLDRVFWRSLASESKSAREMTEQRMKWLRELFSFLESELEFPQVDLPDFGLPEDFSLITPAQIEFCAEALRRAWGFQDQPIRDMILALENVGLPVVTLNIPSDKQDGFLFPSKILNRSFVGINIYEVSAARARFDAAHELGHLVLHREVSPPDKQTEKGKADHRLLEKQAHRFAGALLFPKSAFLTEVRYPSLDYFSALKKRWGMSIGAMVMRSFDLGMIDSEMKTELQKSMSRRKWRGPLREPFDSEAEMPMERPRMLRRGMQALLDEGIVSKASIRSALPLPPAEIEDLAGLPRGYLNDSDGAAIIRLRPRAVEAVDLESGRVIAFPDRR